MSKSMQVTDFTNSYVRWSVAADASDTRKPGHMPWGNAVRIQIDARASIANNATGKIQDFYLIAPCRKEWMYRDEELVMQPGGEYRVIFGEGQQRDVAMNTMARGDRPIPYATDGFVSLDFELDSIGAQPLTTNAEVVSASASRQQLVGKTRIRDEKYGHSAVLEYPIRTMNYHEERHRFQVDTEPLIFVDFNLGSNHFIDFCRLAHTIYNTFDYAEFACRPNQRTSASNPERDQLLTYSDVERLSVGNELWVCE